MLDTVANWNETVESVVKTKFLWGQGGPNAPHVWCFLRRERLPSDLRCVVDDIMSGRAPGDVFMLTKHWMHSDEWSQATFVCGGNAKPAAAPQPAGNAAVKAMDAAESRDMVRKAEEVFKQGFLGRSGRDFLCGYATGARLVNPRPDTYKFLSHSFDIPDGLAAVATRRPIRYEGTSDAVNIVRVLPHASGDASADGSAVAGAEVS